MNEKQNSQSIPSPILPKLISVGELLRQTWDIYSGRFGMFFGIAAIPAIAFLLAMLTLLSSENQITIFIVGGILWLLSLLLGAMASMGTIYVVARPASIQKAYLHNICQAHFAILKQANPTNTNDNQTARITNFVCSLNLPKLKIV